MKRIGLFCVLLLTGLVASTQKVYFIYVQSDNNAPFYVRLGEKVTSSTASGYVILPSLRDSSYLLQVGFPGNTAESRFPVTLKGEDKGFILKQVGGSWNLFDLQELTLTKALAAVGPTEEESRQLLAQADPFTRRLVQASDDLTLLDSGPSPATVAVEQLPPAPMPARPEPEVVQAKPASPVADTIPVKATGGDTGTAAASQPAATPVQEEPFRRSLVTRRSESSTTEGFGLVFIDNLEGGNDTIRLLIPNPKYVAPARVATDSAQLPQKEPLAQQASADTVIVVAAAPTGAETKDTVLVTTAAASVPVVEAAPAITPAVKMDTVVRGKTSPRARAWVIGNATCAAQAEQKDFLKLRKNMAAADDEGDMVTVARKEFKKRCYTVEQVKLLGTLFLTDLARFNFFESAWGHVSDQPNFPELEADLKDAYLSNRLYELTRTPVQ